MFREPLTKGYSCRNPLKTVPRGVITRCRREQVGEMRTFTMDPQEGASRPPFLEGATLGKPHRSSIMVLVERDVVIC
jgi:hypothetical protein